MKRLMISVLMLAVCVVGYSPAAKADSLFVTLTVGSDSITCDNGTAAGVTACGLAGFTTSLGANVIEYAPASFHGYDIVKITVTGNVPGTSSIGFITDTKTSISNISATQALQVDFGGYDFSLPLGPNYGLSASQTANWVSSVAGDKITHQGWARDDNGTSGGAGGGDGTGTAIPGALVSPGGLTSALSSNSGSVGVTMTPLYSLTGRQVITEAIGSIGSFTGNVAVTQVPEPTTLVLLGTGLLGAGFLRKRSSRSK